MQSTLQRNRIGTASAVGHWVLIAPGMWVEITLIPNANTVRVDGDRTDFVNPSDPYWTAKHPYDNLTYTTSGQWTGESFASGETTLTDTSATFHTYMVGWQIIVDMEFPVALTITARPSATTIKVAGDVRTLTDPGKFYILFAPPWVNPANGTLAEVITEGEDVEWDVLPKGSLYLWAGYRYQPPMVGFNDGGTTVGAQAGTNLLGNYHCNNRVYSIGAGRWLSPDQASSPWWNLAQYLLSGTLQRSDPTGLKEVEVEIASDAEDIQKIAGKGAMKVDGDLKDLMDRLYAKIGTDDCIKTLTINSHGNPNSMYLGSKARCAQDITETKNDIGATAFGRNLKPLMCKPCTIVLKSCNAALGSIPERLADETGCNVEAAEGFCRSTQNEDGTWKEDFVDCVTNPLTNQRYTYKDRDGKKLCDKKSDELGRKTIVPDEARRKKNAYVDHDGNTTDCNGDAGGAKKAVKKKEE